jgi:pSer/pThr/pTyr-binding forkhead associated (FHA) protein
MTNGTKDPDGVAFPEDGDARADAIEERIERLRKMKGWASETRVIAVADVAQAAGEEPAPPPPTSRMALTFSLGADPSRRVELDKDPFDIGSGEAARLRILDPSISARHCRISRDGHAFRVRDLNSQTGTFVNGARIPLSSPLSHGDTLACGAVTFTVAIVDTASPGPAAPSSGLAAPGPAAPSSGLAAPGPAAPSSGLASPGPAAPSSGLAAPGPAAPSSGLAAPGPAASGQSGPVPETSASKARPTLSEVSMAGKAPPSGPPVDVPEHRAAPLAYLRYVDEHGGEGQALISPEGAAGALSVGRKSAAGLKIADHGISGLHASFGWEDGQLVVRDLGSTNGTWLHGERIAEAVLVDGDVVRLGLLPLRVCIVPANMEAEVAGPIAAVAGPEPGAPWTLLFATRDASGAVAGGRVGALTLSGRDPCIVLGSGAVELPVPGLLPEHLQFDWTEQGLEVTIAARGASCTVDGVPVRQTRLAPGARVDAETRVTLMAVPGALRAVPVEGEARRWAGHLRQADASLELLFVEPRDAGGRVELAIWGDGALTVDVHGGAGGHARLGGELDANLRQALVDALICAGFPVSHAPEEAAGGPELHAFRGDDRASLRLTDRVLAGPQWQAAVQLLRAVSCLALLGVDQPA